MYQVYGKTHPQPEDRPTLTHYSNFNTIKNLFLILCQTEKLGCSF